MAKTSYRRPKGGWLQQAVHNAGRLAVKYGPRVAAAVNKAQRYRQKRNKKGRKKKVLYKFPKKHIGDNISYSRYRYYHKTNRFTDRLLARVAAKSEIENLSYQLTANNTATQALKSFNLLDGNQIWRILNDMIGLGVNETLASRAYLTRVKDKYMIANATNMTQKVQIYDIVPRHDIMKTDDANHTIEAYINTGLTDIGGSSAYNFDVSPFKSRKFTTAFRVMKVHSFHLTPGATHQHIISCKSPTKLNPYRIHNLGQTSATATGPCYITGVTRFVLFVVNGTPVYATNTSSVTTAPLECLITRETEWTIKLLEDNDTELIQRDSLTHTVIANTRVLADDDYVAIAGTAV